VAYVEPHVMTAIRFIFWRRCGQGSVLYGMHKLAADSCVEDDLKSAKVFCLQSFLFKTQSVSNTDTAPTGPARPNVHDGTRRPPYAVRIGRYKYR
jgi:hypothetical protein